jgi:hypothetical protein
LVRASFDAWLASQAILELVFYSAKTWMFVSASFFRLYFANTVQCAILENASQTVFKLELAD